MVCIECNYEVCICKPISSKHYQWWKEEKARMNEEYDNWKEVPEEELWEDGELSKDEVIDKIHYHVLEQGDWIILRRRNKSE